jgi:hypothetical protein
MHTENGEPPKGKRGASVEKAGRNARQPKAPLVTRADFMRAYWGTEHERHHEQHHELLDTPRPTEAPDEEQPLARIAASQRIEAYLCRWPERRDDVFQSCGWWWCGKAEDEARWGDLHTALAILRKHDIDPNSCLFSHNLLTFAVLYAAKEEWNGDEELRSLFKVLRGGKWANPLAKALQSEGGAELSKHISVSAFASGADRAPTSKGKLPDRPTQFFLYLCHYDGKHFPALRRPKVAAAILYLAGMESGDFAHSCERVEKANGRLDSNVIAKAEAIQAKKAIAKAEAIQAKRELDAATNCR